MKKTKTIDLAKILKLPIDEETNAFHPSWDNAILLTAYDGSRTFVLTRDGRNLLLTLPLRDVLNRFAQENDVAKYERQALYDLVGARKGRGYIAGHHRLVPTHGTTNANVVYYMAHLLDEEGISANEQQLVISFHGRKQIFRVHVDTSLQTFNRLLKAANEAADYQLDELDWLMHNYGVKKIPKRESVRYYHHIRDHCRRAHHDLREARTVTLLRPVLRDYFTAPDYRAIMDWIKRAI